MTQIPDGVAALGGCMGSQTQRCATRSPRCVAIGNTPCDSSVQAQPACLHFFWAGRYTQPCYSFQKSSGDPAGMVCRDVQCKQIAGGTLAFFPMVLDHHEPCSEIHRGLINLESLQMGTVGPS